MAFNAMLAHFALVILCELALDVGGDTVDLQEAFVLATLISTLLAAWRQIWSPQLREEV